ncbi:alpha/beta hydrolase [Aquimarina rhabdastrellae]
MTDIEKDKIPVQQLLLPKPILYTGKTLNFFSPFLASRFAARLFLTPFRYKTPEREREMEAKSQKETVKVSKINRDVVVYTYGTSSKKILLVHGWSGSGTQLSKIADKLLELGYSTVSFDAPAHGKSPGKISMMPFFIETVHHLEQTHGPFEAAIGHSLGGMSLLRATKNNLAIKKLIIIGTANSVSDITKNFIKNLQLSSKVATLMKRYFDTKFGEDIDNYSGAISAKQVHIPTLVIHDHDDVDVSVEDAYAIDEQLSQSELFLTNNLGHRKILGDSKVIQKIADYILE